jgi:hypothetical protein
MNLDNVQEDNTKVDEIMERFEKRQEKLKEISEEVQTVNNIEPPKEDIPQAPVKDIVQEFDKTSETRQAALREVDKVLVRSSKGAKLDRGDYTKAITNLRVVVGAINEMITSMLYDTVRLVTLGTNNTQMINILNLTLAAVGQVLQKKGIVTQEEFDVAAKEILPKEKTQPEEPIIKSEEPIAQEEPKLKLVEKSHE